MIDLDLRDYTKVFKFLKDEKPELIINAAAKVGGILANNNYPYEFLMDNMLIQNNLIRSSHQLDVNNFIFLEAHAYIHVIIKHLFRKNFY